MVRWMRGWLRARHNDAPIAEPGVVAQGGMAAVVRRHDSVPGGPGSDRSGEAGPKGGGRVGPLSEGKRGARGIVAQLNTRDRGHVQKLMAMGILPGVEVRLIRRFPSFVFQVDYSQFTVDRELADKILVQWEK